MPNGPEEVGMPQPNGDRMSAVKELMTQYPEGQSAGAGGLEVDINSFPELRDKKEGDTAVINVKVSSLRGTTAVLEPYSESRDKEVQNKQEMIKPSDPKSGENLSGR
jgi:hypothetical protein